MFSTNVDHSRYLETELESLYESKGFPFLRLHPGFNNDFKETTEDENTLLFSIHGQPDQVLVLSDKKVGLYKIPAKASFLKRATNTAIGFIPGVGEVLDGIENAKSYGSGAKYLKGWITGANKKEKKRREKLDLPSKKDFKDVKWDLKDLNIIAMISSYRGDILIANGFGWKTVIQSEPNNNLQCQIIIKDNGITVLEGKKKAEIKFWEHDNESYTLLIESIKQNKTILKKFNWSVSEQEGELIISSFS